MKKLLAISAVCLAFFSCNRTDSCCPVQQQCCPKPKTCCPKPVPCCPSNGQGTYAEQQTNDGSHTDADWQVTGRVKKTIMSDSTLSGSARFVSVSTQDGVVTLSGTVSNQDEANMLVRKVKNVSGVRSVNNQLTISQN